MCVCVIESLSVAASCFTFTVQQQVNLLYILIQVKKLNLSLRPAGFSIQSYFGLNRSLPNKYVSVGVTNLVDNLSDMASEYVSVASDM